jgi:hypothetical protein
MIDVKNLIRLGLVLVFILGFVYDIYASDKTIAFYGYLFISAGILIELLLNIILKEKLLFRIQIGMLLLTLSLIIGLFLYGAIGSVESFGLGIMIGLLFALLLSQIIVLSLHILIMKWKINESWDNNERILIFIYTVLFFLLHQVKVPNNYEIPFISYMFSFIFIFIFFAIIYIVTTKILKKSYDIVLLCALVVLIVLHFSGLDLNLFILLPTQIVTLIFLFFHLNLNNLENLIE